MCVGLIRFGNKRRNYGEGVVFGRAGNEVQQWRSNGNRSRRSTDSQVARNRLKLESNFWSTTSQIIAVLYATALWKWNLRVELFSEYSWWVDVGVIKSDEGVASSCSTILHQKLCVAIDLAAQRIYGWALCFKLDISMSPGCEHLMLLQHILSNNSVICCFTCMTGGFGLE